MRLVRQVEYKRHTLLFFEERVADPDQQDRRHHWLIIAPDGFNVLGPPQPTEADARALVDRLVDPRCETDGRT